MCMSCRFLYRLLQFFPPVITILQEEITVVADSYVVREMDHGIGVMGACCLTRCQDDRLRFFSPSAVVNII